ncbi:MAG: hypothetical protein LKK21_03725 [Prevotella sp.]|nr:hypothetical protein [Prevotella sp.]MCH3992816.1 hypothetical protein [Prevotella sp.]MCH4019012.1 hypothetical protein [Prevotella sp.]MCI1324296.1 hypothetical protein [Prevotella sp.]MCI1548567.1 hypothetical protein [Prevotella sp.]MCI1595604.1 hypothetical protein [Prevotella sp.]
MGVVIITCHQYGASGLSVWYIQIVCMVHPGYLYGTSGLPEWTIWQSTMRPCSGC